SDRRQVLCNGAPGVAAVTGCKDSTVTGAEVNAAGSKAVGRHALAVKGHVLDFRKTVGQSFPGAFTTAHPVDLELTGHPDAVRFFPVVLWHNEDATINRHPDDEPEAARQSFTDVDPLTAVVEGFVDTIVVLLVDEAV